MMNTYKIIKSLNLIFHYFSDEVTISVINEHMKKVSLEPDYSANFDVLTDLRDAIVTAKYEDIKEFVNYTSCDLKIIAKRKVVYLTNKPNQVAWTTLLSNTMLNSEMDIFVCSTEDAAINFLQKAGFSKQDFQELIKEIKNNAA